ncbi:MAG: hypothetical protein R2706_08690 [Acidimicrobiales bacterium]
MKRGVVIAGIATVLGGLLGHSAFPADASWHFAGPIDDAVRWAQVNLYDIDTGIGTGPFSDFVTLRFITPLRSRSASGFRGRCYSGSSSHWLAAQRLATWRRRRLGPRPIGLLGTWSYRWTRWPSVLSPSH